ncbi:hypothetical protein NQZ68_031439 [Dissostichus eleginoides]|nr:hypothetical protein NQZ68_031439 [Dissostichus eleginoides]
MDCFRTLEGEQGPVTHIQSSQQCLCARVAEQVYSGQTGPMKELSVMRLHLLAIRNSDCRSDQCSPK